MNPLILAQTVTQSCNCIGPQNGAPACPCMMRNVRVVNGRYVRTQDLGPAPQPKSLAVQARESMLHKRHDGPCWRQSHADCGC